MLKIPLVCKHLNNILKDNQFWFNYYKIAWEYELSDTDKILMKNDEHELGNIIDDYIEWGVRNFFINKNFF